MVNEVLSTALTGLQRAEGQVARASQSIVEGSVGKKGGNSLPEDIVDIKLGEVAFKANAAVVKVAGELQDTLLDAFDEEV